MDFAKRTGSGSAIQYAATDLRYGIDYLGFEILFLVGGVESEEGYQKIVGDRDKIKKLLEHEYKLEKLSRFTTIAHEVSPTFPRPNCSWNIKQLTIPWGKASHFHH